MHSLPRTRFTRAALLAVRPLGITGAGLGALALLGYATGTELLFRPLQQGPATHPFTALAAVLLGIALVARARSRRSSLAPWLIGAVTGIAALRLLELAAGVEILAALTPFQDLIAQQQALGRNVAMGWNTALMYLLAAAALGLSHRTTLSQAIASVAVAVPLIALTGYAYGMSRFYGQMSLTTVSMGFPLACAALLMNANRGALRSVLSPYIGGSVARLQIFLGYFGPFLIGLVLVQVTVGRAHDLFGLFVVLTSWYITWIIVISAVMQDRLDRKRRIAERRLEFAATHDALTGLVNRRQFLELAEMERVRAQRSARPFALLVMDIDHFKQINDRAGHAAGDEALKQVARTIRRQVRRPDVAARVGGEEFAVMLPETSSEAAFLVAERIRQKVAEIGCSALPPELAVVTLSIGCVSGTGTTGIDEMLGRADAALYRAKNSGRNRTERVETEPALATPTATD